jgi:hypothetical protein
MSLTLTSGDAPAAVAGKPFSWQLDVSGGTPPYTWSLPGGSTLPAGLDLSASGLIEGVLSDAGPVTFTVSVTDGPAVNVGSYTLSLTVQATPLALRAGWLMSEIYGFHDEPSRANEEDLPIASTLPPDQRVKLLADELDKALGTFPDNPFDFSAVHTAASGADPVHPADPAQLRQELQKLNLAVLEKLTVEAPGWAAAYQLGLRLSATCSLSEQAGAGAFLQLFSRHRFARLQTWLSNPDSGVPPLAAAIVSRSLANWRDWADVNAKVLKKSWKSAPSADGLIVVKALRAQGPTWRGLLDGKVSANAEPGVNAWVQAGESMVRTARGLALRILRRFSFVVVLVVLAVAGLLTVALLNTEGATKYWTSLVTLAAAFGVSGTTVRAAAKRTATSLEAPVWHAAELEARAWAVTLLPTLPQGAVRLHRLRKQGVGVPVSRVSLDGPEEGRSNPEPAPEAVPRGSGP